MISIQEEYGKMNKHERLRIQKDLQSKAILSFTWLIPVYVFYDTVGSLVPDQMIKVQFL